MPLSETLREHVAACFTGLWIQSYEHDDAITEIAQLCRQEHWRLAIWDIERGLSLSGQNDGVPTEQAGNDPLAALHALPALASPDSSALLVLVNFHRYLNSAEIIQAVSRQITAGKQQRTFVVILAPVVQLPTELEKQFIVLHHALPGREQLAEIARGIATEAGELPEGVGLDAVLDATAGLTRYEAEGAFSLSLVRHGRLEPQAIWELKSQWLTKSGLLRLHRGSERFADLGGLDHLKQFCLRAMRQQGQRDPRRRPRGVMLLSPPGCGKSNFAKALGNETGRPTIILDVGSLMGGLVGLTEDRTRQALAQIDAMAPAVVMIDEVEKALGGVASSGQTDGGVMSRLFGALLTWLNDHDSDVFVVCTCNDIAKLPPEFARAERFDGIYFVDLPDVAQRSAIWRIYVEQYGLDPQQSRPVDAVWTGAEIKACCRLADLLDCSLVEAAQHVVPVAQTAAEAVERLRSWADGRCLSADACGIYRKQAPPLPPPGRKVRRDPSNN
jgi:hypothetical protein